MTDNRSIFEKIWNSSRDTNSLKNVDMDNKGER